MYNANENRRLHVRHHIYGGDLLDVVAPPQVAKMQELSYQMINCMACSCRKEARAPVTGLGNAESEILLVGRNPGIDEDKSGAPFVGKGGDLLDEMLRTARIDRNKLFITNMVHCYTNKDRPPVNEEIDICVDLWLKLELSVLHPRLLVLFGDQVSRKVVGLPSREARLKVIPRNFGAFIADCVVCIHPGAPLHNPSMKRHLMDDAAFLRATVNELFGDRYSVQ